MATQDTVANAAPKLLKALRFLLADYQAIGGPALTKSDVPQAKAIDAIECAYAVEPDADPVWVVVQTFDSCGPVVTYAGSSERAAEKKLDAMVSKYTEYEHDHAETYVTQMQAPA